MGGRVGKFVDVWSIGVGMLLQVASKVAFALFGETETEFLPPAQPCPALPSVPTINAFLSLFLQNPISSLPHFISFNPSVQRQAAKTKLNSVLVVYFFAAERTIC